MSEHDQIEFDDPTFSECGCCGAKTTNLVRWVTREGEAFAVYKAAFSDTHDHDFVSLIAGFGDWTEDSSPEGRVAFAARLWNGEATYSVGVIDPEESCWEDTKKLGRILPRVEALKHPFLHEFFGLTDHIVLCDQPIIEFLSRSRAAVAG